MHISFCRSILLSLGVIVIVISQEAAVKLTNETRSDVATVAERLGGLFSNHIGFSLTWAVRQPSSAYG